MKRAILILLCFFSISVPGYSQDVITGFTCVTPGIEYEYSFNDGWDSTTSVQVCVTGGVISGSSSNCKTANGLTSVKISWNENIDTGLIEVTYTSGHFSKNINITPVLSGGTIDTAKKSQEIAKEEVPAEIQCSGAAGGGCSIQYSYQWQQSTTTLDWKDIPDAQDVNLKFSLPLAELLYFRRKVIEINSGSIAYSDAAVVFVNR